MIVRNAEFARRIVRALRTAGLRYLAVRTLRGWRNRAMERLGQWRRIDDMLDRTIAQSDPATFRSLFHVDGPKSLAQMLAKDPSIRTAIIDRADRTLRRDIAIFERPIPPGGDWPWHSDWAHGKVWPAVPISKIKIYEARSHPYDLKFPMELSRLAFLTHVALAALVETGERRQTYFDFIEQTLSDWISRNPTAGSVVWYSFEGSVRGVFAAQTLSTLIAADAPRSLLKLVAGLIARCAVFTEFYPDRAVIPNNHYIGNLVCLVLAGYILGDALPDAPRWLHVGKVGLDEEILKQFNADGGNFEGSLPYHICTTELCLLAEFALRKNGTALSEFAQKRLHLAGEFAAAIQDPNGKVPSFGDFDSSRYLVLDLAPPGAAEDVTLMADAATRPARSGTGISRAMFGGLSVPAIRENVPARLFPDTGIAVVNGPGTFFLQDVGPVGLRGRGGHGHNDLTSFVLQFDGDPLLSDRGTCSYSADRLERDGVRSGRYHSILMIDDTDIARMGASAFDIVDGARPSAAALVEEEAGVWRVEVCHDGFSRIQAGLTVQREILIMSEKRSLICTDIVTSVAGQIFERRFQFDYSVTTMKMVDKGRMCVQSASNKVWLCSWDPDSEAVLEDCFDYPVYGRRRMAQTLLLRKVASTAPMWFSIEPFDGRIVG